MEQEAQPSDDLSVSPSFNTYSSSAQIADRVRREEPPSDAGEDEEPDDFEFVSLSANPDVEFFVDGGGIRPIFPVFDSDLLSDCPRNETAAAAEESIRIPLKKLFIVDRDPPSSSSEEADDTEGIAPGTYCVWTPKLVEPSPRRCEKSNSTGSSAAAALSKRSRWWRFRDLLKRSNSEGENGSSLVFLTPAPGSEEDKAKEKDGGAEIKMAGKAKAKGGESKAASAHEKLYVRNRKMKEEDKKRSYLPYRQDLVGFFANVNGLGTRTFPPF